MMKKQMAHSCGTGIIATALGYVIKANPGPGKINKIVVRGDILLNTSNILDMCNGWKLADGLDLQSPDSATIEMSVSCS